MPLFEFLEHRFPDLQDAKIETEQFLLASEEIIKLVGQLGKLFSPIFYDMKNNVDKTYSVYKKNETEFKYIQDMILLEKQRGGNTACISMLWLRRGLNMILLMFEKMVLDHRSGKKSENLSGLLREAYSEALEPFHVWVTQKLFHLFCRTCPNREQFLSYLSSCPDENQVIDWLDEYTKNLKNCLTILYDFYVQNGLESLMRV